MPSKETKVVPINIITENKYLIPHNLHQALYMVNNNNIKIKYNPIIKKESKGVFIVSFRRLNNKNNTLIYNYIKYHKTFYTSMLMYLIHRNIFIDTKQFSDKRNYFVLLDNKFLSESNELLELTASDTGINTKFISKQDKELLYNAPYIQSINNLIEITNRILYVADNKNIGAIIDSCVQQHLSLFNDIIFKDFNLNTDSLVFHRKDNLINSSLFIVNNLFEIVKQLEDLGYKVNEGPQKWRGQVNSINSFLSTLDYDYRESLYNHYEYHKTFLNPRFYQPLKTKNFTFKTIHQNIGNIRWYSHKPETKNKDLNLVIWQDNPYSLVGLKLNKFELDMIKLPLNIKSLIVGLLLSDGYLILKGKSKNASFALTQSIKHKSYIYFIFSLLAPFCSRYPILRQRSRYGKIYYSLEIYTRSLTCITELYDKYYTKGNKVIKPCIFNDLTPIAIAHWIMGDGTFNGHSLLFCTDSYSVKQVVILINVLIIKYDINCTINYHKNIYPRIYVLKKDLSKLRLLVKPYMNQSMLYKLGR